ncbi:L,D-transpeptidase family protein [Photobacterium phosphoreum]|jgi:murein L,D-transpeptidase YcbB/YkuD|uniref:L,D-transpeptidase family protein n=1 Tax=Photobacterium phosphoreum TaxID=659 RepID=UPI000CF414B9|nr:L,D-transpeptidase family protein [Photobacterium phosphoreum]MCD9478615.1 L,D-transpeptidase family protein [Photobacterium phosphoreum]MCD9500996.1 L,D-transpeptidase family protein [Photobacterium phosphoreum]MCD9505178.1 L,D-transpeptidase family protein [Photobacterium phosphoreum]MCD9509526.1 L,D-transpeptidase family protein [Photobacterium phosphoreum]PQJ90844.1 murein L,D-transpeptidase [Photobacterium phosphoreum]
MPVVKDALLIVIVIFVSFFWQISCAYSQSIVNDHKERSLDKGNSSFLAIDRSRNMLSHAQKWISDANANITQLKYPTTLVELYSSIGFSQFWENDRTIQDFINQLRIISLSQTNKELTARYHLLIQLQPQQNWQQYDVVATDTLLIYLSFIEQLQGKGKMWLFGEKVPSQLPTPSQVSIEDILMNYENNQFNQFIVSLKPQLSGYNQLVASINRLESHPTLRWPVFSFHGKVGPGSKIKYMPSLITVLERLGDLSPLEAKHYQQQYKSLYTGRLVLAVKRFQSRHGLQNDGIIGTQTQKWLALNVKQRVRLLALNAQRLRLWSTRIYTGIVVNIPNYYMNLWLDGRWVMNSKVIVGRPSRQTPIFNSKVNSVVFNPYWNVPTSITKRDILPKVRRSRSYLRRHNYEVIRSWGSSEKININSIPYNLLASSKFPYRLRQKPGKKNALGLYKFNIPNNQAIYLHDTSYPVLFNKHERALSSGCVRVLESKSLALALLQYSGKSKSQFKLYSRSKKTRTIRLNKSKKVPVEIIYQTAWINDEGAVNYRFDIYDYDKDPQNRKSLISAYNNN